MRVFPFLFGTKPDLNRGLSPRLALAVIGSRFQPPAKNSLKRERLQLADAFAFAIGKLAWICFVGSLKHHARLLLSYHDHPLLVTAAALYTYLCLFHSGVSEAELPSHFGLVSKKGT